MPVTLLSAVRVNAAPCVHYTATLLVDGTPRQVPIAADAINDAITLEEVQTYLVLWARYQRSKGKTLAQMVGQTVIGDIL